MRDQNLECFRDSFQGLKGGTVLRRLDARNIIAYHSDGARELALGDSFCLAQLSNRGPDLVRCSCLTAAKISVRGFGLVKHSIPGYFVAVARRLCHPKEEPPAVDFNIYHFAALISLYR